MRKHGRVRHFLWGESICNERVDIIEEDVNAKFEMTIPRLLIEDYLREND